MATFKVDMNQNAKTPMLMVASSSALGGASLSLLELLGRLPAAGYRATVVAPEAGPFADEAARVGADVRLIPQPPWVSPGTVDAWLYAIRQLPEAVARVRDLIVEISPAMVWTNSSTIPAGALAAAQARIPHLWCVQEFLGQGGMGGPVRTDALLGCIQGLSAQVVAISSALRDTFPEPARVAVISAPVALGPFRDLTPDTAAPVITSIGTISESKGLGDLAEAAILLAGKGHEFRLQVIGDFYYVDYLARIEKRLMRAGIRERVELIPYQREIAPWLARSGLYCCPSHTEGMSRTLVEAMAAGLPVVATDCGGPRDLVTEGVIGHLVPPRNPRALADALASLINDPERQARFGQAGRRAAAAFDTDRVVPRLIECIAECIASPPVPVENAALADLTLTLLREAGPRVLLGRKWRLFRLLLSRYSTPALRSGQ
jgi:glycosyltransferase involved in cell wall biosynthesis